MQHIQKPMFPPSSEWTLPKELPNLKNEKILGLDTETRDPQLQQKGPGVRRDGYLIGISIATVRGQKWYFPFGHSEGEQFDKETIFRWAKDNLCEKNQAKVGANLLYDLDYLTHAGIPITGPFFDVQVAEPLIDENKGTYSLDSLAQEYLGEHKTEDIIKDLCSTMGLKGKPQAHLWRLDPKYVGLYAEDDARQALEIFQLQKKKLTRQGLDKIFDIETRLIPMLLHMRQLGVPIDTDHLLSLHSNKQAELESELLELKSLSGTPIDIWAAESIALAFDNLGIEYPLTPKTKKPSFTKGWLEIQESELAQKIVRCRTLDKFIGTFLEGSMLEMLVGNRIHCEFNALRSDESGTVTGRFSSSHPNLQFIPIRTKEGKEIRECFIPDEGYKWCKADYSQIEIRILAHYARGEGSNKVRQEFLSKRDLDYHQWCADEAGVTRRVAKTINFGLIYGMGALKLANSLNISVERAKKFMGMYFESLPFVKETVDLATKTASQRGYVKTLLGRRRRFNLWEPEDWELASLIKGNPDPDRVRRAIDRHIHSYGGRYRVGIQRAACYKAFNAVDQGTAADIMKKSMVDIWESGLCNTIKPYITVHDELDFGYPDNKEGEEAIKEVKRLMEKTVELKVPVITDIEIGPNWGKVKEV